MMTAKDRLKNYIEARNPLVIARWNRMRKRLLNKDVTFLTPNCIGGILFHDLGLKFLSPTVNLMMSQTDFLKFVLNMDAYLGGEFEFFQHPEYTCPCAVLRAGGVLPDITVHFTHYTSKEDALLKWRERAERIQKENIFVFMEERDGITKNDLLKLAELQVRGVVVFTCNDYPDIQYAVYIPKYHPAGEVGNVLVRNYLDDSREYEQYFDFVKWFNEADGEGFDVSAFKH